MSGPRKYAHDTEVPVDRSRAEIRHLLIQWGCDGIQWTDDFRAGVATLVFLWTFEGHQYRARMRVALPSEKELRKTFARPDPTPTDLQKRKDQRWRALHRVLLLTIRANLLVESRKASAAIENYETKVHERLKAERKAG